LQDRFSESPPLPEDADAVERMKNRLKTAAGKAIYAQRKIISEPVLASSNRWWALEVPCFVDMRPSAANGCWFVWHSTLKGCMF